MDKALVAYQRAIKGSTYQNEELTRETPATITQFWNYLNDAVTHTKVDDFTTILTFKNRRGLYVTEKWVFIDPCWLRVSIR